jgi:hypothetical protein
VHRHLANILRKLSLSSRATAAAWGHPGWAGLSLARSGHLPRPREDGPAGRSDSAATVLKLLPERAGPRPRRFSRTA